jgi:SAM-dependent methyltransferase
VRLWRRREPDWGRPFETLRERWSTVPASVEAGRAASSDLAKLSDAELARYWQTHRDRDGVGEGFGRRGWYRLLYRDFVPGKKIADVGSGLGFDSITFAELGATVTFCDLAASNLELVRRICRERGVLDRARFVLIENVASLAALDPDLDVIMAMGSLHHAPAEVIRPEAAELVRHLKVGGRWLQLAYPKGRWEREGRPKFSRWGEVTDGPGTPWSEWYDPDKLLALLAPARFEAVFYTEWHGGDFNWFDLVYRGPA